MPSPRRPHAGYVLGLDRQVDLRIAAANPHADQEKCHWQEDALYLNTLKGIAFGLIDDPRACAAEAIKAAEIQFRRDCA